eukprot:NODE_124_length_17341_cov_0.560028.p2 type:complete len:665 gc:universal NODE_124_length_17341_cov_0.560028:9609-11603(+)
MNSRFDTSIKNKAVAEYQLTAEHLIREAFDNQTKLPYLDHKIKDEEEFDHLIFMKRKTFEEGLRRTKYNIGLWINYSTFEMQLKNWDRARSIFERMLDIDYRNLKIWFKYLEMELSNKQFNYARNLLERAVNLLPKIDNFWLKYIQLEISQREFSNVMKLYERWLENKPEPEIYSKACQYYTRGKHYDLARKVLIKLVEDYPTSTSWKRLSEYEERHDGESAARGVYEKSLQHYKSDPPHSLLLNFAKFEQRCKQFERCRQIYKYAMGKFEKDPVARTAISSAFQTFEKQIGDPSGINNAIVLEKAMHFEDILNSSNNVDTWIEYLNMEESILNDQLEYFIDFETIESIKDLSVQKQVLKIRNLYERSIRNPPAQIKSFWKRYSFLWIKYLMFEELTCRQIDNCDNIIVKCIEFISNMPFTVSKLWNYCALFYIRQKQVDKARKIFKKGIENLPTGRLYMYYIDLETNLRNFKNSRFLFNELLCKFPNRIESYLDYARFELEMGETDRARAIFEVALTQNVDQSQIWRNFIDFEEALGEYDKCILLFERLLKNNVNPMDYNLYGQFFAKINVQKGREIYQKAYELMKEKNLTESRLQVLEYWKKFELSFGDALSLNNLLAKMPKLVKTKTLLGEKEEYIWPDSTSDKGTLKLLEMAKKWKQSQD